MVNISEYVKSIISIAFFAFINETISLGFTKNNSLTRAFRLIANLCIFLVIITPFFSIFTQLSQKDFSPEATLQENENNNEASFMTLTRHELEERIKQDILLKTGIYTDEISIELVSEGESLEIKAVNCQVDTPEQAAQIQEHLTTLFQQEADIKITVK